MDMYCISTFVLARGPTPPCRLDWCFDRPAAIMLPYPKAAIGLEVTFVFLYLFVEHIRLYLGERLAADR